MSDLLPFDAARAAGPHASDEEARRRAVDPRHNVALEASAGTGKTRVLVERYINLLKAGVDPSNILAITFTRKAAAEMRDRILASLRTLAARGGMQPARWRELRERAGDIDISTIDAFCLSLLREFPLEADLDPGFAMADDTEVPRLVDESLDRALRICRSVAREDEHVALVFAQLGDRRARSGLAALLARRIVAPELLSRFLARQRPGLTVGAAAERAARGLIGVFEGATLHLQADTTSARPEADATHEGFLRFVTTGPAHPAFMLLVRQLEALDEMLRGGLEPDPARVQAAYARARDYFLTQDGAPRSRLVHPKPPLSVTGQWAAHRDLVTSLGPRFEAARAAYRADLNVLVSRGVWRMFRIADTEYRRTLEAHAVLDFPDLLLRTLDLLRHMDEFSRSRYRLESRYHHVLVDEFQDTSRAQWELIALLVEAWGEGAGLAHAGPLPPSIFIVGDRKQSIYRFRDADVSVMPEAIRHLQGLRPGRDVRRSITRSFRSVSAILAFVNDICSEVDKAPARPDAFRYGADDRFPVDLAPQDGDGALGLVIAGSAEACADRTAGEIARLLAAQVPVRDVATGLRRPVRPADIAILFRTREGHREFEEALERRRIPSYVYKGLGFFDAAEVRDVLTLMWHLADPASNLRAAAWLRSGFVRLSDEGLRRLAPALAAALAAPQEPAVFLDARDAASLALARRGSARWRALADHIPPAELLDRILSESAYGAELGGPRLRQARENLKKIRGIVRRAQNRGYATLARIVAHLERLAVRDESNAAADAVDAVNLMTVHAAKGLEFPVVFVVNLSRGTGSRRPAIRVADGAAGEDVSVSVGDFESGNDEDEAAVEREETKRLLYVAITRARDRLYLSSTLRDGVIQPARGSLAEVAPARLLERLSDAARAEPGTMIAWRASSGTVHQFAVCGGSPLETHGGSVSSSSDAGAASDPPEHDFSPIDPDLSSNPGSALAPAGAAAAAGLEGSDSSRIRGTLLHRLVQRAGIPRDEPDAAFDVRLLAARVRDLMRAEESPGEGDGAGALFFDVASTWAALTRRKEVRDLYNRGEAFHEVPFTALFDGQPVHGTIDCLVYSPARGNARPVVSILELKTGRPRPEHRSQALLYRRAAEALFPDARIEAHLVYGDGVALALVDG